MLRKKYKLIDKNGNHIANVNGNYAILWRLCAMGYWIEDLTTTHQ